MNICLKFIVFFAIVCLPFLSYAQVENETPLFQVIESSPDTDSIVNQMKKDIVGKWATENNALSFEFFEDGRVVYSGDSKFVWWKLNGPYVFELEVKSDSGSFISQWILQTLTKETLILKTQGAYLKLNRVK